MADMHASTSRVELVSFLKLSVEALLVSAHRFDCTTIMATGRARVNKPRRRRSIATDYAVTIEA